MIILKGREIADVGKFLTFVLITQCNEELVYFIFEFPCITSL